MKVGSVTRLNCCYVQRALYFENEKKADLASLPSTLIG